METAAHGLAVVVDPRSAARAVHVVVGGARHLLQRTTLQPAVLQHTPLQHAALQHTRLQHAPLQHTRLQHARLQHAPWRRRRIV